MGEYIYITDEHVFESCAKAKNFDEHIEICKPIAKIDTDEFRIQRLRSFTPKGRTKRRFK